MLNVLPVKITNPLGQEIPSAEPDDRMVVFYDIDNVLCEFSGD